MGGWHSIRLSLPRRWHHDLIRPGEWAIPCHLHTLGAGSCPGAVDKCSSVRRLAVAICGYNDTEKDHWGARGTTEESACVTLAVIHPWRVAMYRSSTIP